MEVGATEACHCDAFCYLRQFARGAGCTRCGGASSEGSKLYRDGEQCRGAPRASEAGRSVSRRPPRSPLRAVLWGSGQVRRNSDSPPMSAPLRVGAPVSLAVARPWPAGRVRGRCSCVAVRKGVCGRKHHGPCVAGVWGGVSVALSGVGQGHVQVALAATPVWCVNGSCGRCGRGSLGSGACRGRGHPRCNVGWRRCGSHAPWSPRWCKSARS